jgi:hypothetical protein
MNKNKQTGMNGLLLLFLLISLGFFLACAIKIGPAYLDNRFIVSALKSLAEQHPNDLAELSRATIREELSKFYMINNIRGEAASALEIDRRQEKTIITVAYETRIPFFANVDVVVRFNNVLDSSRPGECCRASEDKSAKKK